MAKTLISIRINPELLQWFKTVAPAGYQRLMCTVLEDYRFRKMMDHQKTLGRAQQIYLQFYARCFWHLKKDLEITQDLIPVVQSGLRKFGGIEGMRLAATLDLTPSKEGLHADQ